MKNAIILGGTTDHIRLVEILKQKGFYCILIDYLDNPPARKYSDQFVQVSILDKERVLEIAKKLNANIVIATCIDQALVTASYVSEQLGLSCHISYESALYLTNKMMMKKKMIENEIPTSEYFILNSKNDLSQIGNSNKSFVIKPVDANSSKGVYKIVDPAEIVKYYEKSKSYSPTGNVIIEEFMEGIELSVDVFIKNEVSTVLMVTENVKSLKNSNGFTIIESKYNAGLEQELKQKLEVIAKKIADAFEIKNGPLLIQCIYNEESGLISVIEFSSRIGGGSKYFYIEKIKGFDILSGFVDVILNNEVDIILTNDIKFAKIKYLYTHKGVIDDFIGFEQLKEINIIDEYFLYKTPGSKITESAKSTDRSAGFLITGKDTKELQEKSDYCLSMIKVLDENKKDILIRDF